MLKRILRRYDFRGFSNSSCRGNLEKEKTKLSTPAEPIPEPSTSDSTSGAVQMNFIPSEFEKKILVWSGKFKSVDQIPPRISFETIDNARSRLRIRLANIMMVGTVIMCGYYVWLGKKGLREGETITKKSMERDRKMLEDYRKSKEA